MYECLLNVRTECWTIAQLTTLIQQSSRTTYSMSFLVVQIYIHIGEPNHNEISVWSSYMVIGMILINGAGWCSLHSNAECDVTNDGFYKIQNNLQYKNFHPTSEWWANGLNETFNFLVLLPCTKLTKTTAEQYVLNNNNIRLITNSNIVEGDLVWIAFWQRFYNRYTSMWYWNGISLKNPLFLSCFGIIFLKVCL